MSLDKILALIAEETKHIQLLVDSRGQVLPRLRLESDEKGGLHVWEKTTGRLWAQFDSAGRLVGLTEILKEHYGPADLSLLVDREAAEAYDFKHMTGLWAKYENSHPVYVPPGSQGGGPMSPLPAPQVLWGEWEPMSWVTGNEEMFYTSGPRTGLVAARVNPDGNWSAFGKGPDEQLSDQVCGYGSVSTRDQAKLAAIEWLREHWKSWADIGQLPLRTKTHSL